MRRGGRVPDRAARPEILARRISGVAIFPCESGRDEVSEQALAATFDKFGGRPMLAARAGLVCVGHDRGQRADCRRRVALALGDELGCAGLEQAGHRTGAADLSVKRPLVTFGQVGEPSRSPPVGEAHPSPVHLARVVRTLGLRSAVKSQPKTRDSLMKRINSLMRRFNYLLC
jgi:hypothetical protein